MDTDFRPLCYRNDLSDALQILLFANAVFALLSFLFLLVRPFLPSRRLPSVLRHWPVLALPLHVAYLLLGVAVCFAVASSSAERLSDFLLSGESFLLFPASIFGIPLALAVRRTAALEQPPSLFPESPTSLPSSPSSPSRA